MTWAKKRVSGWVKWQMEAVWSILSLALEEITIITFFYCYCLISVLLLSFCSPNCSFTTIYLFRLSSGQWSRAESVCFWLIQVKSSAVCAHQLSHMVCLAAVCARRSRAWLQQHRWLWCSDGSPAHDPSLNAGWEACVEYLRGFIYTAARLLCVFGG